MMQYAGKNPAVNGIEHEKQDEVKEDTMFPSGIFDNETQNHHPYDFVRSVVETRPVINEEVILRAQVYYGKNADRDVDAGYGNIEFESQTRIGQHALDKGTQYPHNVGQWDERYGKEHGSPQAGGEIMQGKY
jgi:hypothetical protein